MSRELVVQLQDKKRELYAEKARIESEYSVLHQKHSWLLNEEITSEPPALDEEELSLQATLLGLKDAILNIERKVNNAHFFGPRYTRSLVPTLCIMCFVDHDRKESQMVEVESERGNGIRKFECPVCKHVLLVNPV